MTGPELRAEHADLDGVDAVLAMMIIAERETRPFTPLEQVAVDAIVAVQTERNTVTVATARTLMARFSKARSS